MATVAAAAIFTAPARAESGNGLYEPFPTPESNAVALAFVDRIGDPSLAGLTVDDLRRGFLVGRHPFQAPAPAGPAARGSAAGSSFLPSLGWPIALVLLALVLGTGRLAAVRRA